MINKKWLQSVIWGASWFGSGLTAIAVAQEINPSVTPAPSTDSSQPSWETILETNPHKLLIIGRWRGFHVVEDQKMYYLYDFKADGTYVARHRLYDADNQDQDEFWQGKWDFDGQLLTIEGNESNNPEKKIQMTFKLAEDNFLYAQIKEESQEMLPMKMGKQ